MERPVSHPFENPPVLLPRGVRTPPQATRPLLLWALRDVPDKPRTATRNLGEAQRVLAERGPVAQREAAVILAQFIAHGFPSFGDIGEETGPGFDLARRMVGTWCRTRDAQTVGAVWDEYDDGDDAEQELAQVVLLTMSARLAGLPMRMVDTLTSRALGS